MTRFGSIGAPNRMGMSGVLRRHAIMPMRPPDDRFPLPGLRRRAEALAWCLKDAVSVGDLPQWVALQWIRRTCDEIKGDEIGLAHIRRACISNLSPLTWSNP